MRCGVLAGLCVALVGVCVHVPQPCEAHLELVAPILKKLTAQWKADKMSLLGHKCHYYGTLTGTGVKQYYYGKFSCPGLADFSGMSKAKDKLESMVAAAKDFLLQAFKLGIIKLQDAVAWLEAKCLGLGC
uniref:Anti-lipopolysaccharide factor n=1 Tax=Scylla olivacea TaxID=85551 RepID=A0A0P4WDC5_SCYOL